MVYLAKPFESEDLANGIDYIINALNYDELCSGARDKVVREFDSVVVSEKYEELYNNILK